MTPTPLELAVSALATYRLTKLVVDDKITEDLREKVFERYGDPSVSKVSYLVQCPWCVSVYAGVLVSLSRMIAPGAAKLLLESLAFSAVTGILVEREP